MKKKELKEISSNEFCLLYRLNASNKQYMSVKFKDELKTEDEWKKILKKDGITF